MMFAGDLSSHLGSFNQSRREDQHQSLSTRLKNNAARLKTMTIELIVI
jgi:hypothetical protein